MTEVVRSRKVPAQLPPSFYNGLSTTNKRLIRFYARLYDFVFREKGIERVYVVEGIHERAETYALWTSLIEEKDVVVSFDLYDCGVLFLDGKMPKFNYKVMLR